MTEDKFEGFDPEPRTWNFPMIINGWVHRLSGSEFKVLWYILRHTYGWQKNSDTISYKQFQHGIKKKNGEWLDRGTGLGISAVKAGIRGLVKKGFIEAEQVKDEKGRWTITHYKPRYAFPSTDNPSAEKKQYNINNNKQSLIINKGITPTPKKYSSLKDITELDLQEISEKYKVSLGFVKLQFEKLTNYCEAKGRVYKNYKSALRNFVLGDMQKQIERRQDDKYRPVDARNIK